MSQEPQSLKMYEDLLQARPDDLILKKQVAVVYFQTGNETLRQHQAATSAWYGPLVADAAGWWERAVATMPTDRPWQRAIVLQAAVLCGFVETLKGNDEKGIAWLERALDIVTTFRSSTLQPEFFPGTFDYIRIHFRSPADTERSWDTLTLLLRNVLAKRVHNNQQTPQGKVSELQNMLRLFPSSNPEFRLSEDLFDLQAELRYQLGWLYLVQNNFSETIRVWNELLFIYEWAGPEAYQKLFTSMCHAISGHPDHPEQIKYELGFLQLTRLPDCPTTMYSPRQR